MVCRAPTQTLMPLWLALRPRCMIPCKFQQIIQFFHQLIEGLRILFFLNALAESIYGLSFFGAHLTRLAAAECISE